MTPKEKLNAIYELVKSEQGKVFEEIRDILMVGKTKVSEKKFDKPTVAEIVAYCEERKNGIDGEEFYYFYESKGWKIGKTPMKSWKSAIITWEKNNNKKKSYPKTNKQISSGQKDELMEMVAEKRRKMGII
jgi:hypothetical protein